jgi:hypothetical protein
MFKINNVSVRKASISVSKAKGKKADVLAKLKSFLDAEEPTAVKWLVSLWKKQQSAIT